MSFSARTQAGTASVNDTVMQIASPYLPYGGVGSSGIGRYHGKRSFDTFSNHRSVLVKSNLLDMPLRYPPYSASKDQNCKFPSEVRISDPKIITGLTDNLRVLLFLTGPAAIADCVFLI